MIGSRSEICSRKINDPNKADISFWKPSDGKLLNSHELNESKSIGHSTKLYPVELLMKPWKFRFRRKKYQENSGNFEKFKNESAALIDAYLKISLFTINYINSLFKRFKWNLCFSWKFFRNGSLFSIPAYSRKYTRIFKIINDMIICYKFLEGRESN